MTADGLDGIVGINFTKQKKRIAEPSWKLTFSVSSTFRMDRHWITGLVALMLTASIRKESVVG
jgi:hypothetical protein